MAGFFKRLFCKGDEVPKNADYSEISKELSLTECEIEENLKNFVRDSKPDVLDALSDLRDKAGKISFKKVNENKEITARVKTVVEKSLPGFASALENSLPKDLSDDPEEYYRSLVEIVQGAGKALKGPGRYIHAVFPDEIKGIKASLGVIGHAINSLNEELKPALEKKAKITGVREALSKTDSLLAEYESSSDEIKKLRDEVLSADSELSSTDDEISSCRKTHEFMEYERSIQRISSLEEEMRELKDSFHACVADVSNVFRKIIYASEKDGNLSFSKSLFEFDSLLISAQKKDAEMIKNIYSSLYPEMKRYLNENPGFVRNKSEEHFLSSEDVLKDHIGQICKKYSEVSDEMSKLKNIISGSLEAEKLSSLKKRRVEIETTKKSLLQKISALEKRIPEIEENYPMLQENLISAISSLKGQNIFIDNFPALKKLE
jgi:predicted  nucleic acid-binding Zn-ribbon protein